MYKKIKRELYATDCECLKLNFIRPIGCRVLAVKCSKSDHLNLEECTRQLTRMMDLMPSDFAAVNSTLPACAMIPNQQNFTRHDERFNFSTTSRTAKSGKFTSVSRAIKRSDIHLEVLSLQNRKSFEYSRSSRKRTPSGRDKNVVPLFSPNLRHFSQRFRRIQS